MKFKIRFIIGFALLISQPLHAQYFGFEPTPKWVKTINISEKPPVSKNEIISGFYETLVDYQVNLDENALFYHEVRNVVSYSGITNASQLSVSIDTSYQKLKIHYLNIWRKGNKTDRTKDLSLEIMNNEQNLQRGIYSGQVIVYDILNDIRKDDLIDFAYTIVGKNPIFDDEKYLFIPLVAMNPIDLYSLRIVYLKGKDYTYKCTGCDSLITSSETEGFRQIELRYENVKAIKLEENMPSWTIPYKYFELSSFKSWKDVNIWAQKVFALKKEPELTDVFNEIFKGNETTEEKINKIINYVQDEIRYMGIESGIGSIKPLSPEQVVKQRFGDCKDKSLLLVTLLKKIGIAEAYPALVNTTMRHELQKVEPSNEVFNHCIVTFKYNDTSYWVDPTIPLQGGDFKDLNISNFSKALVIGMPADTLQNMSPQKTEARADVVDEYTITSFTEPAKLKITSKRNGFEADDRRALVEYFSPNKLLEQTLNEFKLQFPSIYKTSDLEVDDDIEKNIFSLTYNFEIDGFWQDGDKGTNEAAKGLRIFRFEPIMLYQDFNVSACTNREFDYKLNYPMNLYYRVIFHFPKDMLIDDDYKTYDNEAFYYEEKVEQLSSNSFQIEYKYRTKVNYIKAADYKKICEQKNTIAKKLPTAIYFPK
jgi:hypothetical protein